MSLGYTSVGRRICWPSHISLKSAASIILRRSVVTEPPHIRGLIKYAELENKGYIEVMGPESVKFINGLVSSKLQATFIKKNLTTIGNDIGSGGPRGEATDTIPVQEFDITKGNWGLYHETGSMGPYLSRFGQYTSFLDGKGKLITDSILYPTPLTMDNVNMTKYPKYLYEFDKKGMLERMLQTLQGHKLLSKVKIQAVDNSNVKTWDMSVRFQNIPKEVENPWIDNILRPMGGMKSPEDALTFANTVVGTLFAGHEKSIHGLYIERRTDEILKNDGSAPLMFRIITDNTVNDASTLFNQDAFPFEFDTIAEKETTFRKLRLQYGLLDGAADVKPTTVLPLELNFDYFPDVVSSNKGCYVGQELTARTFATGILRKRLIPVTVNNPAALAAYIESIEANGNAAYPEVEIRNSSGSVVENVKSPEPLAASPFGSSSRPVRKRKIPVGSLISSEDNAGVVMLRTEYFDKIFDQLAEQKDKPILFIDTDNGPNGKEIILTPQEPFWLNEWFKSNKPSF